MVKRLGDVLARVVKGGVPSRRLAARACKPNSAYSSLEPTSAPSVSYPRHLCLVLGYVGLVVVLYHAPSRTIAVVGSSVFSSTPGCGIGALLCRPPAQRHSLHLATVLQLFPPWRLLRWRLEAGTIVHEAVRKAPRL